MTNDDKLNRLKIILEISDTSEDDRLSEYLDMAEEEIICWLYTNYDSVPEDATLPRKYEQTQVQAVITGFNLIGAENQRTHNENGVNRTFVHADMLDYIHNNVIPYLRIA